MSLRGSLNSPAFRDPREVERDEEWNNFMKRVGEVKSMVKDLSSGDRNKAEAAKMLADKYLQGKVILDEDVQMTVKSDRTVINQRAFRSVENKDTGEIDKDAWMAEVSKDAERRAQERKIRREKADTLKTQAEKAFRRGEYEKALSCYNKAMEHVRDNSMLYCDRALTNIKLGNYQKVFDDCHWAQRLNENSFKARLYRAKAHLELEEMGKYQECRKELEDKFPQHQDLIKFFLDKPKESKKEDGIEEEQEHVILI